MDQALSNAPARGAAPGADAAAPGHDEELRRALLVTLGILDTGPEAAFDGLTVAATAATGCPIGALTLVEGQRLWFKSCHGLREGAVLPERALAERVLQGQGFVEITDLAESAAEPGPGEITPRYFAGVPVRVEGVQVGALCVFDTVPRQPMPPAARQALTGLAAAAEGLLAARRPGADHHGQALRRRQQLLSRVSHEMRTPLNAIQGFAQLLRGDPALAGQHQAGVWVRQIEKASERLLVMVEEMLELARLEAGRRRLAPAPIDWTQAVRDVIETLEPQATARSVRLALEGAEAVAARCVLADARALRQILINLVGNAVRHSPVGATVTLRLRESGRLLALDVVDRGPGIAPDDQPHLFQPFEPVGGQPAGLGLAISRQLAESLHGRLEFVSQPGAGSTFTLQLPAAPPAERPVAEGVAARSG